MESKPLGTPVPGPHLHLDRSVSGGGAEAAVRLVAARAAQNASQTLEGRNAFLAKASLALGRSLELDETADSAARLLVPQFAVGVLIDLKRPDGTVRRMGVAHEIEEREIRLRTLAADHAMDPRSPQWAVLATGSPQLGQLEEDDAPLYPAAAAEVQLLRELHCRSYLCLPLSARGSVFGCITLLSTGRHTYGVAEFTTISEYARRAALAFDHALLYQEALHAREAAEAAQEQFHQLVNGFRESEDRYRALFEESHDAIYVTRDDGKFIEVNPAALQMFGYTRAELLRLDAQALYVDVAERERFREEIETHGFIRNFELRLRAKDGHQIDCLLSSMVRRGAAGEALGYQGIIHDVSARTASELKLRDFEHFTRTIVSSIHQGVIVYDTELRYQLFNRFMEEITGMRADQVIGRLATEVFPHLVDNGAEALLTRALAGETVQSPDMPYSIPATGRAGWTSALYSPHLSLEGEVLGVVAIVMDTTERKRAEDQLTYNAFHDALTGLPNRALFVDRLERLMRHTKRSPDYVFGVAFLDLDRFKLVNDSLGHLAGDELLVAIGRRLQECVRLGDTVARLGGDEFALLLDNVPEATDATSVAERILTSLVEPFIADKHEVYITASIGIALSSTGYEIPEEILRDADTAMYRAKLEGRSRYEVFDRHMHEKAVHVLQVDTDLRRALERNEFMLYYQPIIALDHGHITGFEALIRWKHPQRGIVAPADFIPVAEENGLIVPIGWWVLEEAATQITRWNERFAPPKPLTMAVNLSPKQFLQSDLLQQLDIILARTGIDPGWLKLEITESVVIQNEGKVSATLAALRGRGIQLCIDDFGTGYSSLSYLHAFPIDTLKIDRSFVGQIGFTGNNSGLVETIVALSRNLGMDAVAEGVETSEQLAFLREIGPQFAQGYFFSPALAADQIEDMLERDPVW